MRAYLEAARKNRKLQRIASTVAVFAAVFVVCGVFWALKDTGIAMTGDPACGFVEHTHTDACYAKTLTCGLEESEGHAHSVANGCYAAPAGASSQAQAPGGKAAASATTSEAASASASSQSQSQAQAAAAPAQSQSTQTLTCDKQETPAHAHSEACYEKNLTCTVPEHTHSKSCYENAEADVETAQDWEATLPASLTGKWPSDAVAVAQSQLGYAESQSNRAAGEDGAPQGYTRYGAWSGSPYAKWSTPFAAFCLHYAKADGYPTGSTAAEWANALQSQECRLYHPAEGNYEPKPGDLVFLAAEKDAEKVANARTQAADALAQAQVAQAAQTQAGEGEAAAAQAAEAAEAEAQAQVESAYDGVAALADGMAVVEEVLPADQNNPARIRVIQGDSEDATQHVSKVQRVDYPRADARILGYAELPENSQALQEKKEAARQAASEAEAQDVTESQDESQITQTFEGEGYAVKATYGPEAQLPEGAELRASEYAKDSEHYQQRYAEAAERYGWEEDRSDGIRLFDVGFYVGDEEVEPAAPVKVTITYAGQQQEASYEIVHFGEEPETVEAETAESENGQDVSFTLNSFSDIMLLAQTPKANAYASTDGVESDSYSLLTPHKTIDAFRDDAENPDTELDNETTDKTDLYRLYLDAQVGQNSTPVDLLIVVDQSYSMKENEDMQYEGKSLGRDAAIRQILNGTDVVNQYNNTGLISQFLAMNDQNEVAVIGFHGEKDKNGAYQGGDAEVLKDWMSEPAYVGVQGKGEPGSFYPRKEETEHGTNYCAGLLTASNMLAAKYEDSEGNECKDHKKIMIFLSDGVPTLYLSHNEGSENHFRWGSRLDRSYVAMGGGKNERDSTQHALEYFREYIVAPYITGKDSDHKLTCYTVGVSSDMTDSSTEDGAIDYETSGDRQIYGKPVLKKMAHLGNGKFFLAVDMVRLINTLNNLMVGSTCTDVTITDTLSDYVNLADTPDFKVTLNKSDGTKETLYVNQGADEKPDGSPTDIEKYSTGENIADANGNRILSSVNYNQETKTVTAVFSKLDPGTTATLSFNVKTTQDAYDYHKEKGYPHTGDADTDFSYTTEENQLVKNVTSSNQAGFHSNESATVSYKTTEKPNGDTKEYPHPVVQVNTDTPDPGPNPGPGPSSDSTLEHHKTIDAFRDDVDNPDTGLDNDPSANKSELYRLYLDVTSGTTPMDVLFVVDRSNSMDTKDVTINGASGQSRFEATKKLLSGDGGLIHYVLSQNDENKVAVCSFGGLNLKHLQEKSKMEWTGYGWETVLVHQEFLKNPPYPYTYRSDAKVVQSWTSEEPSALALREDYSRLESCENEAMHVEGTNYDAGIMVADDLFDEVQNDGREKIMIFLSDGVPTFYIDSNGQQAGTGHSENRAQAIDCIDKFAQAHSEVTTYAIGLEGNTTDKNKEFDSTVLKYMSEEKGHGKFFSVKTDMDQLKRDLEALFKPSKVSITDNLSDYVDLYTSQPDYKVIMTKVDGTEISDKVLYEDGKITDEGNGKLESVTYDSNGKKVTAKFVDGYCLEPGWKYTLSFNVKLSDKAKEEYKTNGGYSGVVGDANTDYPGNNTSSGWPGFHSNNSATLHYEIGNKPHDDPYQMPVVQAPGYELPQTGGGGFGTLFGAGAVLVACAGAGLAAKRRRGARLA